MIRRDSMTRAEGAWAPRWILLMALALLWPASSASGQRFEAQSLPVPMEVERQTVPSSLYLKVEMVGHGQSISAFASSRGQGTGPAAAFADLMVGLKDKDLQRAGKYLIGRSATGEKQLPQVVESYHQGFAGFQGLAVIGQALVGDRHLFIWEVESPRGPFRRAFAMHPDGDGFQGELISSRNPVEKLILDSFQKATTDPGRYGPKRVVRTSFEYELPITSGEGSPVLLQFEGVVTRWDVFGDEPAPHDALAFYRSAYGTFIGGDTEGFLDLHTEKSREKLVSWFGRMPEGGLEQYRAATRTGRHVWFVLETDPLYLIFYTDGPEAASDSGSLKYDYVVRERGGFRLTNTYIQSYVDDLLGNPELFAGTPRELRVRVLGMTGSE